jgi:hypothetical protein
MVNLSSDQQRGLNRVVLPNAIFVVITAASVGVDTLTKLYVSDPRLGETAAAFTFFFLLWAVNPRIQSLLHPPV